MSVVEYQDLTVEGRNYEAAYSDYWNSTITSDGRFPLECWSYETSDLATGQIVDAVIMPVAPHAAVIPGKYYHTGELPVFDLPCDLNVV